MALTERGVVHRAVSVVSVLVCALEMSPTFRKIISNACHIFPALLLVMTLNCRTMNCHHVRFPTLFVIHKSNTIFSFHVLLGLFLLFKFYTLYAHQRCCLWIDNKSENYKNYNIYNYVIYNYNYNENYNIFKAFGLDRSDCSLFFTSAILFCKHFFVNMFFNILLVNSDWTSVEKHSVSQFLVDRPFLPELC